MVEVIGLDAAHTRVVKMEAENPFNPLMSDEELAKFQQMLNHALRQHERMPTVKELAELLSAREKVSR